MYITRVHHSHSPYFDEWVPNIYTSLLSTNGYQIYKHVYHSHSPSFDEWIQYIKGIPLALPFPWRVDTNFYFTINLSITPSIHHPHSHIQITFTYTFIFIKACKNHNQYLSKSTQLLNNFSKFLWYYPYTYMPMSYTTLYSCIFKFIYDIKFNLSGKVLIFNRMLIDPVIIIIISIRLSHLHTHSYTYVTRSQVHKIFSAKIL